MEKQGERGITKTQGLTEMTVSRSAETMQTAVAEQARAQIQSMFALAKQFPRSIESVRTEVLSTCKRPRFAKGARYKKPISGAKSCEHPDCPFSSKPICGFVCGLNVHSADEFARIMKNLWTQQATVYEDDERRIINIQVVDLEASMARSETLNIAKTIERRNPRKGQEIISQRENSYGDTVYIVRANADEFEVKVAAACSKVRRNLELKMIPRDIRDEAEDRIFITNNEENAIDPDAKKREIIDAFDRIGVTVAELEQYLGHALNRITPKEITMLREIYNGINSGETTWEEVIIDIKEDIEDVRAEAETQSMRDKLKKASAKEKPKAKKAKPREEKHEETEASMIDEVEAIDNEPVESDDPELDRLGKSTLEVPTQEEFDATACKEFKSLINDLNSGAITPEQVKSALNWANSNFPGCGYRSLADVESDNVDECKKIRSAIELGK